MKHDRQVVAAFEEAFDAKGVATEEKVAAACEAVFEKAAEQFGEEGLYVFGILNPDMGGVSFRFKRPGVSQRVEHFIQCNVPKPPRKADAPDSDTADEVNDDTLTDDDDSAGSLEDRGELLKSISLMLEDDDFTTDGEPKVGSLNDHLPEGAEPFTADERDELWED